MRRFFDGLWTVGALLGTFWMAGGSLRGALETFAWLQLAMLVLVIIHEGGHALVAWMVGFKVHRVVIGAGPLLVERTIGEVTLQWNLLPFGGFCMTTPRRIGGLLRARQIAVVLGGPASNLLLLLLTMHAGIGLMGGKAGNPLMAVIAGANTATLAFNLFPWVFQRDGQKMATDGLLMIRTLFASGKKLQEGVIGHYVIEATAAARNHRPDQAFAWLERARLLDPTSQLARNVEPIIFNAIGQPEKAEPLWRAHLDEILTNGVGAKQPALLAMLQNNLAWAIVRVGDRSRLDEADRLSKAAIAHFPNAAFAMGTRGSVLSALGSVEHAMPLLRSAYAGAADRFNRASCACELATTEARRGQPALARRWIERARRHDPLCQMIPATEAALAGASSQPAPTGDALPALREEAEVWPPLSDTSLRRYLRTGAVMIVFMLFLPGSDLARRAGLSFEAAMPLAPMLGCLLVLVLPGAPTVAALGMGLLAPAVLILGGLSRASSRESVTMFAALVAVGGAGLLGLSHWIGARMPTLRARGSVIAGSVFALAGVITPVVGGYALWRSPSMAQLQLVLRISLGFLPLLCSAAAALAYHPRRGRGVAVAAGVLALAWLVAIAKYTAHAT